MRNLDVLFRLSPLEDKGKISARFKNAWEFPEDHGPIIVHLDGEKEILMEFDKDDRLAFAETQETFTSLPSALLWAQQVERRLAAGVRVVTETPVIQPLRRTAMAMDRLWRSSTWVQDDSSYLQVLVAERRYTTARSFHVSLSLHVRGNEQPRSDDHSSCSSPAWIEYDTGYSEPTAEDVFRTLRHLVREDVTAKRQNAEA